MNNYNMLNTVACRLYLDASAVGDYSTILIAAAAIKGIAKKRKKQEQAKKEYVSTTVLKSLTAIASKT